MKLTAPGCLYRAIIGIIYNIIIGERMTGCDGVRGTSVVRSKTTENARTNSSDYGAGILRYVVVVVVCPDGCPRLSLRRVYYLWAVPLVTSYNNYHSFSYITPVIIPFQDREERACVLCINNIRIYFINIRSFL